MKHIQWEERTLKKSLSKLKDGTHFSPQSKTGPFKYITSKNIKFGCLDLSNVIYISECEHKKIFQSSPVDYGDILFTKDGANTGNAAINTLKEEFSVLSSIAILSGKKDILDNKFLFQLLLSPMAQRKIKSEMAGQAITRLTLSQLGAFTFIFPSLAEQQKIACILSTWDAAITCTQKLIENSKQQKKALMQQLLTGRRRLPGFNGEWREQSIQSFSQNSSKKNIRCEQLPVLSCSKHYGFIDSLEYFKKKIFSNDLSTYKIICRGEFGYPANHIEEGAIGYQNKYSRALVSPIYIVFKLNKQVDANFVYSILKTDSYRQKFSTATSASVDRRGSLRWSEFSKIKILLPPLDEQKAIADVLTAADALIAQYETRLAHLQMQKKALMQQLLTGKIRVAPASSGNASATPV